MADTPNILIIVLDSVRRDRLSCYGYDQPTSPALDSIAAEGVRFDWAYSESSWTLPVSFSLLTGLAPREHLVEQHRSLPDDMLTLPEALRGRGYSTFAAVANPFLGQRYGLPRGFDEHFMAPHHVWWSKLFIKHGPQLLGLTDQGGQAVTRRFASWLEGARSPWFALLWYNDAHHPYSGRRPHTTRFCPEPIRALRRLSLFERMRRMMALSVEATDEDLRDVSGLYDGAVAYTDGLVGQVREQLERRKLWDDTLAIVTADHGDMLGEKRLMGHGRGADMYDPLIRVPLVMRGPGLGAQAEASEALVQTSDITHTVAAAAGLPGDIAVTAAQTVDLREAAGGAGRAQAICECRPFRGRSLQSARKKNPGFDFEPHLAHMTALVREGWKLIHRDDGRHEVYDLCNDPAEEQDLLNAEPDRAAQLTALVEEWQQRAAPHPAASDLASDDDPIVDKRLRDLGYY